MSVGVYLSLNGTIIPNHGYVVISDIGSTDDTALICHTNRPATQNNNAHSGGNWFAPDDTRVTDYDVPGFLRTRGPMVVRLLRNTATDTPSEGIYHCQIMDAEGTYILVNVGLYNSGGGICMHTRMQKVIPAQYISRNHIVYSIQFKCMFGHIVELMLFLFRKCHHSK